MSAIRKNFLRPSMFALTKHFLKSRPTPYISLKCSSAPDNNRNTGLTTYQVWSEEYLFTRRRVRYREHHRVHRLLVCPRDVRPSHRPNSEKKKSLSYFVRQIRFDFADVSLGDRVPSFTT